MNGREVAHAGDDVGLLGELHQPAGLVEVAMQVAEGEQLHGPRAYPRWVDSADADP